MLTRFIPQIKIERREKNVEVVVLSKFSRKREVGARMKQAKKFKGDALIAGSDLQRGHEDKKYEWNFYSAAF